MAVNESEPSFIRRLREKGLLLPIVVGLLVLVILGQGYLAREGAGDPEASAPTPQPTPTSTPFRPDLDKIPLTYFSDYWLQLGERAHHLLVSLGATQETGVRVSAGYALSSVATADAVTVNPGEASEGHLVAVNGREGAALFRLAADVGTAPLPTADGLHAGAWLAAVTMDDDHSLQVTPGHLASTPPPGAPLLDVAIPFPRSLDVAAIVDLDARLVGVALRSLDGVRVIPADAARKLVDRLASNPACRAVEVAPLTESVRAALRLKEGVVVERLDPGAFAAPPDLQPGDVILQLGRTRLSNPEDFVEAWDSQEPGGRVRFLIARGGQRIVRRTELPGRDCRPDGATPRTLPLLGAVVQWTDGRETAGTTDPGFRMLHVPTEGRTASAGIAPGDILVAIDGKPLAWPDARRLLAPWKSRHVPVLTVRRGHTTRLLVLPEEGEETDEAGE